MRFAGHYQRLATHPYGLQLQMFNCWAGPKRCEMLLYVFAELQLESKMHTRRPSCMGSPD
jgi:hypothetical protein